MTQAINTGSHDLYCTRLDGGHLIVLDVDREIPPAVGEGKPVANHPVIGEGEIEWTVGTDYIGNKTYRHSWLIDPATGEFRQPCYDRDMGHPL
jgi:hypothetical protein